jgi:putative flippase GtrA
VTADQGADRSLFRFLLVGVCLAALYAVLAAIATSRLPLPRALSAALIWLLCIPIGFWLHRRFTFVARQAHRQGLWLYAATQVLGVGIAAAVSFMLAQGAFWPDLFVNLLAAGLAASVSYLISYRIVFPAPPAE